MCSKRTQGIDCQAILVLPSWRSKKGWHCNNTCLFLSCCAPTCASSQAVKSLEPAQNNLAPASKAAVVKCRSEPNAAACPLTLNPSYRMSQKQRQKGNQQPFPHPKPLNPSPPTWSQWCRPQASSLPQVFSHRQTDRWHSRCCCCSLQAHCAATTT